MDINRLNPRLFETRSIYQKSGAHKFHLGFVEPRHLFEANEIKNHLLCGERKGSN